MITIEHLHFVRYAVTSVLRDTVELPLVVEAVPHAEDFFCILPKYFAVPEEYDRGHDRVKIDQNFQHEMHVLFVMLFIPGCLAFPAEPLEKVIDTRRSHADEVACDD